MQTNRDVAALQKNGCFALANLAQSHAENQAKIAAAGGIDTVLLAMWTHQNVAALQQHGCAALAKFPQIEAKIASASAGDIAISGAMRTQDAAAALQNIDRESLFSIFDAEWKDFQALGQDTQR